MPQPATEYIFSHENIARLMLKDRGISEGLWLLTIGFSMSGATIGPSQEEALPSAIVGIQSFGLQSTEHKGPMVFDAAKLNPKK